MKTKFTLRNLIELLCVIAMLVIIAALLPWVMPKVARADATGTTPYQPNFYRSDTNACPFVLTNGGALLFPGDATNSLEFTIRQNQGLGIFVTVVSTNSKSVGVNLGWDLSYNGNITNGTTTQPFQWGVPANFVGTNTYFTNIDRAFFNNFRTAQLTTASNNITGAAGAAGSNTNTVTIQKIVYTYGNQ